MENSCENNFIFTRSENSILSEVNRKITFAIADTKYCFPMVSIWTQDNTKLLQQFKSGFKPTIKWNKYQSQETTQTQNQYLDYLNDPSFQRVNRLLVL